MRVIALKTLRLFWEQHPDARQALQAWYRDTKRATWTTPADIRTVYRNASFVGHNRVVFNIRGNRYRLVVAYNAPKICCQPEFLLESSTLFQSYLCAGSVLS